MSETSPSSRSIALALAPGTLLAGVAGGIVFPIFPIVGHREGLSLWFIGIILAANRAVRVLCAPLIGVLADRYGGRRTLIVGLALQIVVMGLYILGLVTHHVGMGFLVGRILHGPGSACVFVAAQTLALQAGGESHGGEAAGTVRAAIVIGVPIGFVAGGLLSEAVGDFKTFVIAGAAVTLAFVAALVTVPDLRAKARTRPSFIESIGAIRDRRLFSIGLINFALSFASGGMVLTTLALVVESRHLVLFGRNDQGTAGLLMGIMSISDAVFTPVAGRLGDRRRVHGEIATLSIALIAVGLLVVGLADGLSGTVIGVVLIGVGGAGLGPSVLVLMGAVVPPERRGAGAGLLQLSGDLGGMSGPLLGTALLGGSVALPYLITALLTVAVVPLSLWLTKILKQPPIPSETAV